MKKILLIEDDEVMSEAIEFAFSREGFEVLKARDGRGGIELFKSAKPDVVLLDLMLPGIDGLEVCREIRKDSSVPILIITAKDSEVDEVVGLELGADDYVKKPFNMRALIARVKALLRRGHGAAVGAVLRAGDIELDAEKREVRVKGEKIELTPMEYKVLEYLMRNSGKAVSRETLLEHVWGGEFYGIPKTLDVHIRHLREKIEEEPSRPRYVITVRGYGYRFQPPQEQ